MSRTTKDKAKSIFEFITRNTNQADYEQGENDEGEFLGYSNYKELVGNQVGALDELVANNNVEQVNYLYQLMNEIKNRTMRHFDKSTGDYFNTLGFVFDSNGELITLSNETDL